jgi:membrane-associated phospholipid phosphatase
MTLKEKAWIVLFVAAISLSVAARYWTYFPGDVALTRFVQFLTPTSTVWAEQLSATAKSPWKLVLLAVTIGVSWKIAGWRYALLALVSFSGMWVLGKWLGPVVARPRPSSSLVRVAEQLSGSSFPSVFALTYASTVGFLAVFLSVKASGTGRMPGIIVCSVLLLAGWAARLALGAHWPSDILLSYLIGFLWAALLLRLV